MNARASFFMRHRAKIRPLSLIIALVALGIGFRRPLIAWFMLAPSGGAQQAASAQPAGSPTPRPSQPELAPPKIPLLALPAPALDALRAALGPYEKARALLAQDRLEGVDAAAHAAADSIRAAASAVPADASEMSGVLSQAAAAADRLATARSIDAARAELGELSRFLVAVAVADPRLQEGLHVFTCPMAKGFKRWFQPSPQLENPYMGKEMLTCGSASDWVVAPAEVSGIISHEGHGHAGSDVAFYTCSMHPSVKQNAPGKCPICGMDLTSVTFDEKEGGVILVDDARRQRIGVRIGEVTKGRLDFQIRAVGRLTYDETRLKDVTLKIKGYITRLHVNATGQPVKKGQTLFAVYSPELYAAQQEYLLAIRSRVAGSDAGAPARSDYLVTAAKQRLRLLDVSSHMIGELEKRGEPFESMPFPSPASGYVIEKSVVEGAAVEPGQRLYRIAALDKVWVDAEVYEADLPKIRVEQPARVTLAYLPGEVFEGKVAYVYPYLEEKTRTGRVRIELANKKLELKPDMYANVEFDIDLGERLLVPESAVLYTGPRRLVFIDLGEGRLRPQEVKLGTRAGDHYEVLEGLREGQRVVTSGNFLVAAESRIRSATEYWSSDSRPQSSAAPPVKAPPAAATTQAPAPRAPAPKTPAPQEATAPAPPATVYWCPMHHEVRSDRPGTCPKCGMTLEVMPAGAR